MSDALIRESTVDAIGGTPLVRLRRRVDAFVQAVGTAQCLLGVAGELRQRNARTRTIAVFTAEAEAMSRRLAREEALFAGTSSGANVVAALRVAGELGPDATVVTLLCDSGLKYLSTELYRTD